MNRRFFRRSKSFSEQSANRWPSRVKHETSRTLPFVVRSKWMAPPCARTCKTRCSCFEIFNGLSLESMSAEKASGISRGSLPDQISPIRWTLAAGRNRRHKISIALRPRSTWEGISAVSGSWQAGIGKIETKGRFVRKAVIRPHRPVASRPVHPFLRNSPPNVPCLNSLEGLSHIPPDRRRHALQHRISPPCAL